MDLYFYELIRDYSHVMFLYKKKTHVMLCIISRGDITLGNCMTGYSFVYLQFYASEHNIRCIVVMNFCGFLLINS